MFDQVVNGLRRDLLDRALGKPLCGLLLASSVAVHVVVTVGIVEQANCLPAPFDLQLEHDRVALQRTALELDQDARVVSETTGERISHPRNVVARPANSLRSMANDAKQKARAELRTAQAKYERSETEREKAASARRESFQRARKAGMTLREIGEVVGMHHTRVGEILRRD